MSWMIPQRSARYLEKLIASGGPCESEYADLTACLTALNEERKVGRVSSRALKSSLIKIGGPFSDHRSLIGAMLLRERHGDFQIMEQLYANHVFPCRAIERWDQWFQALSAAAAVRERKHFLVSYLDSLARKAPEGSVVAVLACGSAREIYEHLAGGGRGLFFHCFDIDPAALSFAEKLLRPWNDQVVFFRENVLRFQPRARYCATYSSGLFDYVADRRFVALIRTLRESLDDGGELFLGNFAKGHASHGPMGCAGWILRERSAADLISLALSAGVPPHLASVSIERSRVNWFLRVAAS